MQPVVDVHLAESSTLATRLHCRIRPTCSPWRVPERTIILTGQITLTFVDMTVSTTNVISTVVTPIPMLSHCAINVDVSFSFYTLHVNIKYDTRVTFIQSC